MSGRSRRNPALAVVALAAALAAAAVVTARKARHAPPAPPPSGVMPGDGRWRRPLAQAVGDIAELIDRVVGWDRLPKPLGLATLYGLRTVLRRKNMYDTSSLPAVNPPQVPPPNNQEHLVNRVASGAWNSLDDPAMGMAGSRFGRNIPLDRITAESDSEIVSSPSPREVSRVLMTRTQLNPATTVNSLVTAWLQFMVRDWFSHGPSPAENPWVIPLQADDDWPETPMRIMRTPDDPTRPGPAPAGMPPTFINTVSHWWDGSQIYGASEESERQVRTGADGKLKVLESGRSLSLGQRRDAARVPGFWLGLLMMHTIFTKEHNAICDRLKTEYPQWNDDELFQRARLINAALMAKIHTVEWTPAVISHPTTKAALRANWYGLAGERIRKQFGRISDSEAISGIPGSKANQHGVPYSLTEEFVAVYRMHPLVRDDWPIRALSNDALLEDLTFRDLTGANAVDVAHRIPMTDLLYSFGTLHPGLVTLHNYPRALQEFERPDGHLQDLAATDILRCRELAVPRYNEFRRLLRLAPAKDFDDLTDNPEWAEEIRRVYAGDIERVDLVVGMYAERLPKGFAFSDTAFRIFILMASRRLNCDRFLTTDYTPAVYTPAGLDWIDSNSMATVLLRHYPELRIALASVDNAFTPWPTTRR